MIRGNDIVVRTVPGGAYIVTRVDASGGRLEDLGTYTDRENALSRACRVATGSQRVFLYPDPTSTTFEPYPCERSR
jgi:hypothetical protein